MYFEVMMFHSSTALAFTVNQLQTRCKMVYGAQLVISIQPVPVKLSVTRLCLLHSKLAQSLYNFSTFERLEDIYMFGE